LTKKGRRFKIAYMSLYLVDRKKWRHVQIPTELYAQIKAIAEVRGWPQYQVFAGFITQYLEGLDRRAEDIQKHAKEYPGYDEYLVFEGPKELESMSVSKYRRLIQSEYEKNMRIAELAVENSREKLKKKAMAKEAQRSARPQAEAVAGAAGQGDDG